MIPGLCFFSVMGWQCFWILWMAGRTLNDRGHLFWKIIEQACTYSSKLLICCRKTKKISSSRFLVSFKEQTYHCIFSIFIALKTLLGINHLLLITCSSSSLLIAVTLVQLVLSLLDFTIKIFTGAIYFGVTHKYVLWHDLWYYKNSYSTITVLKTATFFMSIPLNYLFKENNMNPTKAVSMLSFSRDNFDLDLQYSPSLWHICCIQAALNCVCLCVYVPRGLVKYTLSHHS